MASSRQPPCSRALATGCALAVCLLALVLSVAAHPGKWGPVTGLQLVPAAVAVVHTNELIMWASYLKDGNQKPDKPGQRAYTQTATMNLATRAVTYKNVSNTQHDMFCPGLAMMADGRIHVVGGSSDHALSFYNPVARNWTKGKPTVYGRGYSGDAYLTDGRVLVFGGSWNGDPELSKAAEVWSPATGAWTLLPNVRADDVLTPSNDPLYISNYRWLFSMDNGAVFNAGPANRMKFFTTAGQGGSIDAGIRDGHNQDDYSRAVMWAPGKLLVYAGYQRNADELGDWDAHTITMANQGQSLTKPTVQAIPRMSTGRAYSNPVLLPNGFVIVFGGQKVPRTYTDYQAVLYPEMWNPGTRTWTKLPPAARPRTYHSVATLLADGTVFTGGGGLCNTATQNGFVCPPGSVNHLNYEIYSPGYLFNEDGTKRTRPVITAAPASANHGATIQVTTNSAVQSFVLIRCSATTHGSNNDQRRVPLAITSTTGNTYSLRIPLSKGVVLAGYHFLFALDARGTPSVAKFIQIRLT